MEKNIKNFEYLKIQKILKEKNFVAIAVLSQQGNTKKYNFIKKKLCDKGFACTKTSKTIFKKSLIFSIFKHQIMVFSGPLIIITQECYKKNFNFLKLKEFFQPEIYILTLKIGFRFFPFSYSCKMKSTTYLNNKKTIVTLLNSVLKNLTKQTYVLSKITKINKIETI